MDRMAWTFLNNFGANPCRAAAYAAASRGRRGPPVGGFGGRDGFGFGGFGPPGGPGSPWNFFRRGAPRARRGDIRAGILLLLGEQPYNGYQIMQELERRSQGTWRPSAGSIYPALQQLEDEGLIIAEDKLYRLTLAGTAHLKEHAGEMHAPWEEMAEATGDDTLQLMLLFKELASAAMQVAHHGNAQQLIEARKVLTQAKRSLYGLLAEPDPESD
jgi:DNA-binding PadR family transcriptional regulator